MRVIPEITVLEGADTTVTVAGNTFCRKCLCRMDLPGRLAHIESPRAATEQERPRSNRRLVAAGAATQGRTEAASCQRFLGVGLSHSSDESREGLICRVGGAKGRAEQGTWRRER